MSAIPRSNQSLCLSNSAIKSIAKFSLAICGKVLPSMICESSTKSTISSGVPTIKAALLDTLISARFVFTVILACVDWTPISTESAFSLGPEVIDKAILHKADLAKVLIPLSFFSLECSLC